MVGSWLEHSVSTLLLTPSKSTEVQSSLQKHPGAKATVVGQIIRVLSAGIAGKRRTARRRNILHDVPVIVNLRTVIPICIQLMSH
mmetsp:Transcript_28446/g.51553  ORF Transcript_28446/g.51553 Transcript_28446/m.51553 type:complete len:85 (-) Transcript_28446:365-619(-)